MFHTKPAEIKMSKLKIPLLLLLAMLVSTMSTSMMASDKPIKHLDLPDVTSMEEAKQVFASTTSELKQKQKLNAEEVHEIHIVTYSLEKAIAYFVENSAAAQLGHAKQMADVVELVHLASENNRSAETQTHLEEYFKLANTFSNGLK